MLAAVRYHEHMETMEPFGVRLRRIREQQGLSVRELARRSGVSAATVSETERGIIWSHGYPPMELVRAYAGALTVPMETLAPEFADALSVNDVILQELIEKWRARLGDAVDRLREMREVEDAETFSRVLDSVASAMAANAENITRVAALLKSYRGEG